MLNCSIFVSNGPLAQSVVRGANSGECVRDSYGPVITFYLDYFLFLSSFQSVQCLKNAKFFYSCIEWSVSSVGRAWC